MANARTSFDLRTERLRTIDYRAQQSSPVVSSPTIDSDSTNNGEVDDWIKSVRALKERRQAEDEARNKQLEEDILRERRARQERRANRSRSVSPAKSLRSISEDAGDVSTKVAGDLVKDYRSVNHDALAETRELEAPQPIRSDPVRQATSPGTINTYLTEKLASPRNSDDAPRKSAAMVNPHHAVQPTEPEAHISNVMQSLRSSRTDLGFQNSPSRNGQSQAKAQIRSSPVFRTGRIFGMFDPLDLHVKHQLRESRYPAQAWSTIRRSQFRRCGWSPNQCSRTPQSDTTETQPVQAPESRSGCFATTKNSSNERSAEVRWPTRARVHRFTSVFFFDSFLSLSESPRGCHKEAYSYDEEPSSSSWCRTCSSIRFRC